MVKNFIGIDQYGHTYEDLGAFPRKALMESLGFSHADKMYVDKKDGSSVHVGYVIGGFWIRLYVPFEGGK